MYLFSMVLFTRIDSRVPMFLWDFVDDLPNMWTYAWGPAVHNFTTKNFKDIASSVQRHSMTGCTGSPSISGCAFALIVSKHCN
jgi:hypothetical protein